MEKNYKRVPFDIELAKKIQAGEVEGRIVTNEGNEVEIVRFNLIQNSFPILAIIRIPNVVSDYWEDAKLFQLNGKHGNGKLWLEIELPEEEPKHKFKVGDKVKIVVNERYPSTVGKFGTVVRAQTGSSDGYSIALYKVRLDGHRGAFFGLADDECLEPVSKHEFKPFDKVLVRTNNDCYWLPRFFHRMEDGMCRDTNGSLSAQFIPYEGNEHLVGTTNSPS